MLLVFCWNKPATVADARDELGQAAVKIADGGAQSTIDKIDLSEFAILLVSLSGSIPERSPLRLASDRRTGWRGCRRSSTRASPKP